MEDLPRSPRRPFARADSTGAPCLAGALGNCSGIFRGPFSGSFMVGDGPSDDALAGQPTFKGPASVS